MPASYDRRRGPERPVTPPTGVGPSVPGDPDTLVDVDSPDDFSPGPLAGEDPGVITDWPDADDEGIVPVDEGLEETANLRRSIEELP
ncbi:MAG TPA: hypothetical protein VGL40_06870 [Bacillota bacterium]